MYNKHEIQWDQAASWSLWTPSPINDDFLEDGECYGR